MCWCFRKQINFFEILKIDKIIFLNEDYPWIPQPPDNLHKIYHKIKEYNTIIIHRHTKPDGDALGSQIGLKEAILATFPTKCVKVVGDISERYSWIGSMDEISDELYNGALVIVLDTGAEKLISDERYNTGNFLIKIDHHIPQGEYGDISVQYHILFLLIHLKFSAVITS